MTSTHEEHRTWHPDHTLAALPAVTHALTDLAGTVATMHATHWHDPRTGTTRRTVGINTHDGYHLHLEFAPTGDPHLLYVSVLAPVTDPRPGHDTAGTPYPLHSVPAALAYVARRRATAAHPAPPTPPPAPKPNPHTGPHTARLYATRGR